MKCDKGYKGDCCCNCDNQIELFRHPGNKYPRYEGSILNSCDLFVCMAFGKHKGVIFEDKHGCCEMHQIKESK